MIGFAMESDNEVEESAMLHNDSLIPGLYIHPYWADQWDTILGIPQATHYALGIYMALIGLGGITGNFIVIYLYIRTSYLRTAPNLFIINMAISDLGFSLVNGFPLFTISSFMRRWYWGQLACELYAFAGGLFGFVSIFTLAFASLDRYYVIAFPFEAMKKVTKRRAMTQIIFVWIWSLFWSLPPLFGWGKYITEGFQTTCSFDFISTDVLNWSYVHCIFFFGFVVPVLICVLSYIGIFKAVKAGQRTMKAGAKALGAQESKEDRERQQDVQLAKVACVNVSLYIISWSAYAVMAMSGIYGYVDIITPYTVMIPVMVAKASAVWNPVIYALSHPKFRAALQTHFPNLVFWSDTNVYRADSMSVTRPGTRRRVPPHRDVTRGPARSQSAPTRRTASLHRTAVLRSMSSPVQSGNNSETVRETGNNSPLLQQAKDNAPAVAVPQAATGDVTSPPRRYKQKQRKRPTVEPEPDIVSSRL